MKPPMIFFFESVSHLFVKLIVLQQTEVCQ